MRALLNTLAQAIQTIEDRQPRDLVHAPIPTGWSDIDAELGGGLSRGAIHEWFADRWGTTRNWFPPLAVFMHLAQQTLALQSDSSPIVVWIGRRCWPSHFAMWRGGDWAMAGSQIRNQKLEGGSQIRSTSRDVATSRNLLDVSFFVDPPDEASRLWAMDLALRSPAVAAVVADGSGLQMAHTRRLQLAAESGNAMGLFARSLSEMNVISAARTRWRVRAEGTKAPRGKDANDGLAYAVSWRLNAFLPAVSFDISPPRWRLELLRCKGVRPATARASHVRSWVLEYRHAKNRLDLSAHVADRPDPAAAIAQRWITPVSHQQVAAG